MKYRLFVALAVGGGCSGGGGGGNPAQQDGSPMTPAPDGGQSPGNTADAQTGDKAPTPGVDSQPSPGVDAMRPPGMDATPSGTPDAAAPAPAIVEDRSSYAKDDLTAIKVNVTVTDLAGLQKVEDNVADATVKVLFQEGTFATGLTVPNADMELRGHSTRYTAQKSYKIHLSDAMNFWRDTKVIEINKHPYDLSRIRNKLAFDLFETIPNFTSLRTHFINLFINGADKGLYTQIEHINKRMLTAHGLDPDGQMYKANSFEFQPLTAEQLADPTKRAPLIESKSGVDDPTNLQAMLKAVNSSMDIDTVIERYFQRDNYITWLAVNLLIDNVDTLAQNFYLYNPTKSSVWYFMPWDYDGAWSWYEQADQAAAERARYHHGVTRYWAISLHRRFLQKAANRAALTAKIEELSQGPLAAAALQARAAMYHGVVRSFVEKEPDIVGLPTTSMPGGMVALMQRFEAEYTRVTTIPATMVGEYRTSLSRPMPVWTTPASVSAGMVAVSWEQSVQWDGHPLVYDAEISKTPAFAAADVVASKRGLTDVSTTLPAPAKGNYFFRVVIRDTTDAANWQTSFGYYFDPTAGHGFYGGNPFVVP
jgi:hypothetical protein